jgi:hypothetical protein
LEGLVRRKIIRFESKNAAIMAANKVKAICRPIEFEGNTPTAWGLTDVQNIEVPKRGGDAWDAYLLRFFREGDLEGKLG